MPARFQRHLAPGALSARQSRAQTDRNRGSARQRGYTTEWDKASREWRITHPLCAMCERNGRFTPAALVDHIIPHRGDARLFWDRSNWQSLCTTCHSSTKQAEEQALRTKPPS